MNNTYADIQNGVVANLIMADPDYALSKSLVLVPPNIRPSLGWVFNNGIFVEPEPPQPPPAVVPQSVMRGQFKRVLILSDIPTASVQAVIDAIPDIVKRSLLQIEWDDSPMFVRDSPFIIMLATAVGLSSAQLDDLFIQAGNLV